MFDHVKFGVSDYAASKAFFLKALAPLGVTVASEGPPAYGVEICRSGEPSLCLFQTDESQRTSIWPFERSTASKSMISIARRSRPVPGTTARPVCDRTITRTTMRHSSLVPTDTTLKSCATRPSADYSMMRGIRSDRDRPI